MSELTPPRSSRTSTPPAGVPPSGHAKHIAIIIALVLGIVGLLALKFVRKPAELASAGLAPSAPLSAGLGAATSTSPTPLSKVDDVPPPPPPEEEAPEAGPAASGTVGSAAIVSPGGPCDGRTCSGVSTPDLERTLAIRARQARRCYEKELANDNTLRGRIVLAVRVGSNGSLCSTAIAANELGPTIGQCVLNVFRQPGAVPSPKKGCVDVKIPIAFEPGR